MWSFLVKYVLSETNGALIAIVAFFVVLFSFVLFAANADGWRFGLIGVLCLCVLTANDFLSRPKRHAPKTVETETPDETRLHMMAALADDCLTTYIVTRYDIPDVLKASVKDHTILPETLALYTGDLKTAKTLTETGKVMQSVLKHLNTTSSRRGNVS